SGAGLGIIQDNETKYLDKDIKISTGATLEIEGAKQSLELIHDISIKDFPVRGGRFFNDSWNSETEHKYMVVSGGIRRVGNAMYFVDEYNNYHYSTAEEIKENAKNSYIEFEVDFNRLPIGNSRQNHFLDFRFNCQIVPIFDHPTGRGVDP